MDHRFESEPVEVRYYPHDGSVFLDHVNSFDVGVNEPMRGRPSA